MNIEDFKVYMTEELNKFVEDYYKQNKLHGDEMFPLTLPEDNDGLWFEFFSEFHQER